MRRTFSAHELCKSITQWKVLILGYSRRDDGIRPYVFCISSQCSIPLHGHQHRITIEISMSYGRTDNVERSCRRRRSLLPLFFLSLSPRNLFRNGKWIGKSNGRMYSVFNEVHCVRTNESLLCGNGGKTKVLHCSRWTFHFCRHWKIHLRPLSNEIEPNWRAKKKKKNWKRSIGESSVRISSNCIYTCVMDGSEATHKENP